jgi:uncharacterized protein
VILAALALCGGQALLPVLPPRTNRLAKERSRYLLQHAANPVDWYPWGDEALSAARANKKLIFLSIGYSTCHWCHVMEKESFSDDAVGALMNRHYVAIKVDREERPDVDAVYMAVAQTLVAEPGWPLNLVLTPDGTPFFAATYLPKDRLTATLDTLARTWAEHPEQISASATMVMRSLKSAPSAASALGADALKAGYDDLAARFDAVNGGFLPPPKFPAPHELMFLLRYWHRTGEAKALTMVETTLQAMRRGALHDEKGGGFRRYVEDAEWRRPHYEKMLYDQALLALCYLEAFQATRRDDYAKTAREIFAYVLRDLRSPNGMFYAAIDADATLEAPLPAARGEGGAKRRVRGEDSRMAPLTPASRTLSPQAGRGHSRDEKIVADWNGLMIAALAAGATTLDDASYAAAAKRAADSLLSTLRRPDGRLLHQSGQPGYLDDYAFTTWGLLNLYEATFDLRYLQAAIALQRDAVRLFRDGEGRFFVTAADAEALLLRPRQTADAAIPSGNSVQLMNLLRLAHMTMNDEYATQANDLLRATASDEAPSAATHLLSGVAFLLGPSYEVVLAGSDVRALRRAVFDGFVPNKVVLNRPPGDSEITRIAPFTAAQQPRRGRATAYVCTDYRCRLPTSDPAAVRASLRH